MQRLSFVLVAAPLAFAAFLNPGDAMAQLAAADAQRWLDGYEQAWETRDGEAAGALFTTTARYFETPWSAPFDGRQAIVDYWQGVTADQRNVDFSYELVAVNGMTAVARWHAQFELTSNDAALELDGVFILQFATTDAVAELREWWVLKP